MALGLISMWTQAYWIAIGIAVTVAVAIVMAAAVIGTALQRASDRRRARRIAADPDRVTVDEIQAKIAAANREVYERLAMETVIRHDREFDRELATAATTSIPSVPSEPTPAEDPDVPSPRPPLRARRYLDARASAGRAGTP